MKRIIALLTAFLAAVPAFALDPQTQSAIDGQTSQIGAKYGSTGAVGLNISAPGTNAATPFTTLDGSQSFIAPLVCPSSSSFLEITAIASPTGDIALLIKQQTDLASNPPATGFNYIYTVPLKITYACGNGFIACDPGTAINCVHYAWTVNQNLQLGVAQTPSTSLGGCFCINNSCGSNLFATNQDRVLSALGGGIVATIQQGYPQLAVSKASVSGSTASYYGMSAGSCTTPAGGSGSGTPLYYAANPGALAADAAAVNAANNSFYADLQAIQLNSTGTKQLRPCINQWQWNVQTHTLSESKSGSGSMCIVYDFSGGVINTAGTDIYMVQLSATTNPSYPGCPGSSPITADTFDLAAVTLSLPPGAVSPALYKSALLNASYTDPDCSSLPVQITGINAITAVTLCGTSKMHSGSYNYTATLEYMYDAETETYTNGCAASANDPNCVLKAETEVDATGSGVQSWADYNPTGLHVLASGTTRTTTIGTYTKTRNWWKKERTYLCSGGQAYDLSHELKRSAAVTASVQGYSGGTTQNYNDYVCDPSGASCGTVANAGSVTLNPSDVPAGTPCEPACKVNIPMPATAATGAGNQSQYLQNNTNASIVQYRLCGQAGTVCPLDAAKGETAVPDANGDICYCTSEYPTVASTLSLLSTAAQSMICSSGTPQCPPGTAKDPSTGKCI